MAAVVASPRRARRCDLLGGFAVALGLAGIGLGVAAPRGTWFVVVPIALLAIIFGLIDVSRGRHDPAADGPTAISGVVAGAVALVLGGWGTGMFLGQLDQLSGNLTDPAVSHLPPPVTWDQDHVLGDGLAVRVAPPQVTPPTIVTLTIAAGNTSPTALGAPTATLNGTQLIPDQARAVTVPQ